MQQRQLRLGDILDDYCPRERRVTNHAVVAMVGDDVKQTRCTTCDAEHEYKHAKVPRQRRKAESPAALYSQVLAGGPKRVAHDPVSDNPAEEHAPATPETSHVEALAVEAAAAHPAPEDDDPDSDAVQLVDEAPDDEEDEERAQPDLDEGPVHRPLIRASLPRPEGQPPPQRQAPEFTIRQPGGRPGRFRPRHQRGGQQFQGQGNRSGGMNGPMRSGRDNGRPPTGPRMANRHGSGRKRSK